MKARNLIVAAGATLLFVSQAIGDTNNTQASAEAPSQVADPPMFAAFKRFCAVTGDEPDAIEKAVQAAGGTPYRPPASTNWPWPMTVSIWHYEIGGKTLSVGYGTTRVPASRSQPERTENNCTLLYYSNDDASVEAIKRWVGVRPGTTLSGNPTVDFFSFQDIDGTKSTVPSDKAAYNLAATKGHIWRLVLLRSKDSVSVEYIHQLPP